MFQAAVHLQDCHVCSFTLMPNPHVRWMCGLARHQCISGIAQAHQRYVPFCAAVVRCESQQVIGGLRQSVRLQRQVSRSVAGVSVTNFVCQRLSHLWRSATQWDVWLARALQVHDLPMQVNGALHILVQAFVQVLANPKFDRTLSPVPVLPFPQRRRSISPFGGSRRSHTSGHPCACRVPHKYSFVGLL